MALAQRPQDAAPSGEYEEPQMLQPPRPARSLTQRTRRRLRAIQSHGEAAQVQAPAPPRPDPHAQGWAALREQRAAEARRQDRRDFIGLLLFVAVFALAVSQIARSW